MNKISGHEVTIVIGTALPKLDLVVQGVLNFSIFTRGTSGNLACVYYIVVCDSWRWFALYKLKQFPRFPAGGRITKNQV